MIRLAASLPIFSFLSSIATAFPLDIDPLSTDLIARQLDSGSVNAAISIPDNWPVKKGYVAFGDSYAAGIGTGTTSTDKCRVGSNNFADLLMLWMGSPNIDFQKFMCSGDTTVGLNGQIDRWQNPQNADIATLSMGGNDVGFSDIAWDCIVTPSGDGPKSQQRCANAKAKARALMTDTSDNGIGPKLKTAYKKILDKSGRDDFHLYVTGYIGFFNAENPDCDNTTFYFWNPKYDPTRSTNGVVWLDTSMRKELNDLVGQFNNVISGAISDLNTAEGRERVHFVDMQPSFDKHRWCEVGNYHEPAPDIQDTWLFLSAWPDVPLEGAPPPAISNAAETQQLDAAAGAAALSLPDPTLCESQLGTDPDPVAYFLCRVAEAIAENPTGDAAQINQGAETVNSNGTLSRRDIPSLVPTRWAKAFHPRSPGTLAYRDALISAITQAQLGGGGGGSGSTPPPGGSGGGSPTTGPEAVYFYLRVTPFGAAVNTFTWTVFDSSTAAMPIDACTATPMMDPQLLPPNEDDYYPVAIESIPAANTKGCSYKGASHAVGQLTCDGVSGIVCTDPSPNAVDTVQCGDGGSASLRVQCTWG